MTEKGKKAGLGSELLVAASVVAIMTLGALTALAILAVEERMDAWLETALIVNAVRAIVVGALGMIGKSNLDDGGSPGSKKTIESVKEDVEWLKSQTKSDRR